LRGEDVYTYSIMTLAIATSDHNLREQLTMQTYQQCGLHSMYRDKTLEKNVQFTNASNVQTI